MTDEKNDDPNTAGPGPSTKTEALLAAIMGMRSSAPRSAVTADAASLIGLAQRTLVSDAIETADGGYTLFVSDGNGGLRAHNFAPLNPNLPDFITAQATFNEPSSMIEYVDRFKLDGAMVVADLGQRRFRAYLDYHEARGETGVEPTVKHNKHAVTLLTPYDDDYAAWKKILGVEVAQADFGVWLEDMLHTVCQPDEDIPAGMRGLVDPADLLDMLNTISIQRNIEVKSVVNSRDGTIKMRYEEDDASDIELPREVLLKMPVFAGTAPILLLAKLRFAVKPGGAVVFKWAIPGLPNIERFEFRKIGDDIATSCSVPVLYGQTGS